MVIEKSSDFMFDYYSTIIECIFILILLLLIQKDIFNFKKDKKSDTFLKYTIGIVITSIIIILLSVIIDYFLNNFKY